MGDFSASVWVQNSQEVYQTVCVSWSIKKLELPFTDTCVAFSIWLQLRAGDLECSGLNEKSPNPHRSPGLWACAMTSLAQTEGTLTCAYRAPCGVCLTWSSKLKSSSKRCWYKSKLCSKSIQCSQHPQTWKASAILKSCFCLLFIWLFLHPVPPQQQDHSQVLFDPTCPSRVWVRRLFSSYLCHPEKRIKDPRVWTKSAVKEASWLFFPYNPLKLN